VVPANTGINNIVITRTVTDPKVHTNALLHQKANETDHPEINRRLGVIVVN
jgi:hypothetical protein